MFIATVISAIPKTPRRFTTSDAPYAHAAVLSAITRADESAGRALHENSRHKIFSCALLPGPEPFARIRIAFHSDIGLDLLQLLISALNRAATLRLGSVTCEIQSVDVVPSDWTGVAGWADLLDGSQDENITLRFITPTAIMKTDGAGRRYSSLLPEPTDVFLGLQRRWDALGGPALSPDLAEILSNAGCIISRHQLATATFRTSERLQIGFQGSVTYQLRHPSPEFVQSMCALARLAHYTGVGYQTTRGMGLIQTSIGR